MLGPRARATSVLDRYKPYLLDRCQQGVTGTTALLAEIIAKGYRGGERTLRRWLIGVRGAEPNVPTPPPTPSAREITAWIMRPDDKLTDDDRAALADARARCPDIATITDLAGEFTRIVRHLHGKDLHNWLAQIDSADVAELRSLANGLRKDLDAVMAGLTMTWSSGAVEGNVNRIWQMYGRAKFDLLRKRILAET